MCSQRGLEARRPQEQLGRTPITFCQGPCPDNWSEAHGSAQVSSAAAPREGPPAYNPTSTQGPGRRDRQAAGTEDPLLRRFASRRPPRLRYCRLAFLGLHFQDALHVVLAVSSVCLHTANHALRPRQTGQALGPFPCPSPQTDTQALGPLPTPPAPRQTDRLPRPLPRPRTDRLLGPSHAPSPAPEASTFSAPPSPSPPA